MRNPWRLLLLRSYSRSQIHISTIFSHLQVQSSPYYNTFRCSFSSLLHNHSSHHNNTFEATLDSRISNYYTNSKNCRSTTTSGVTVEQKDVDVVTDSFMKESDDYDEIKKKFELIDEEKMEKFTLNNLNDDYEFVLKIMGNPDLSHNVAKRFFDWVLRMEKKNERWYGMGLSNVTFSSDLVKMVLGNLNTEPIKCYLFFRWVEGSGLFKNDENTCNAMLLVLGREDCIDMFWNVADEMMRVGWVMKDDTYANVMKQFLKRKMVKDVEKLNNIFLRSNIDMEY